MAKAAPWFVKRRGAGWRITGLGWIALLVFVVLFVASVFFTRGVGHVILPALVLAFFIAISVGRIDLTRLETE